jgi:hypothetical protein
MFLTSKIKRSKKWPKWLKTQITKTRAIGKSFSSLGLKHCSEVVALTDDKLLYEVYDIADNAIDRDSVSVKEALNNLRQLFLGVSKHKIVFSYDPWDIATMSMRGIDSCQAWNSTQKYNLVGSIVDPNCAVIYMTNGRKTKYGEKMLARSVVRIVYNSRSKTKTPALYVEDAYVGSSLAYGDQNTQCTEQFVQFLRRKLRGKRTRVLLPRSPNNDHYVIPTTKAVKAIPVKYRSYLDSDVDYDDFNDDFNDNP